MTTMATARPGEGRPGDEAIYLTLRSADLLGFVVRSGSTIGLQVQAAPGARPAVLEAAQAALLQAGYRVERDQAKAPTTLQITALPSQRPTTRRSDLV
jgi:hypothetical protein